MESLPPKNITEETEILILGTAPGKVSLKVKDYYQNPSNRMKDVLDSVSEHIKEKIGFWDVFKNFESLKESSLDKNRLFGLINDFDREVFNECPKLRLIIFNGKGKKSIRLLDNFIEKYDKILKDRNIEYYYLQSTSGVNPN